MPAKTSSSPCAKFLNAIKTGTTNFPFISARLGQLNIVIAGLLWSSKKR